MATENYSKVEDNIRLEAETAYDIYFVAEDDSGRVRAIIPVYFEMNSAVAVAGHCMADPENTARESYDAIDAALRAVVDFARRNKRKYLVSIYGNRGVNRMAGRIGMIPADIVEEKFLQLR